MGLRPGICLAPRLRRRDRDRARGPDLARRPGPQHGLEVRRPDNSATTGFASWRSTGLGVVSGWIDWKNGWSGMYTYASGSSPRSLRSKSTNVSFGHALFPSGGSVSACASGAYDANHREVARRLSANGVGDAEIRLGWEANGDWFPWTAAGKPADQ